MNLRLSPIALAVAAAIPSLTFAADEPATLETLTIKGRQEVLGVTQIDRQSLSTLRASTSDTASLLRDIPGVSLYSAGGVSNLPVIHGLADDRIRTQVDGMDLISSCPNHMNSPLSYIDPTSVESVKVYTGITPVSVGGDSIGGTIQVNSSKPVFAQPGEGILTKGQAGTFFRSNGNVTGTNIGATIAGQNLSVTYAGSSAKSDNYKAGGDFKSFTATGRPGHALDKDVVGSTAYETINQNLGIAVKGGNHLVELKLGWQNIPYELYPNQRMDMLQNKQERINLKYEGNFDWGKLETRFYDEKVNHFMDFGADKQFVYGSAPGVVAPGMPMYTRGKTTGLNVKAEIALTPKDLLRVGAIVQNYRLDDWWPPSPSDLTGMLTNGVQATMGGMAPNTFWNINNGRRDRTGVFGEWEANWSPTWMTLLGARTEQVTTNAGAVQGYNNMMAGYSASAAAFNARDRKRTDNNLDLTALTRYTPDSTKTFEFGYAQKTRSPNLYERYSWSQNSMALIMNNFVGDGNGYLGDPNLKPEVAHTLSVTGDWHDAARSWEFKTTPYYTHVDNYIDAIRCTGSGTMMNALCGGAANNTATNKFVQLQYANQSAELYGIDVSGRMILSKNSLGTWGLKGLINYTKGKNLDTGDSLYNIIPLTAKLMMTQDVGKWSNGIEVVGVRKKDALSDARQEIGTAGYSLVNLRGRYSWDQVRLDFGVENMFDRLYYLPQGGAYSGQGMTMSTNGIPWGIAVPGMGRTFYAGLNVKF